MNQTKTTQQPIAWSNPHHGVSHITSVPRSHQITMNDYGVCARAYMLDLRSAHPYTPVKEITGRQQDVKAAAEAWARALLA